jgi:hypothetical protein
MKYSIFIPRLSKQFDSTRIKLELEVHLLGDIEKIDIVEDKKCRECNMVFVHYSKWNSDNIQSLDIKNKLDGGTPCSLYIFSLQYYWKILKAHAQIEPIIPFNPVISRPTLFNSSTNTPSIFSNMLKDNSAISLFDRMNDSDKLDGLIPNIKTNTNNDKKIQELEDRISKLEKYIYNHVS